MKKIIKFSTIALFLFILLINLIPVVPVNADNNTVAVTPSLIIDSVNSGSTKTLTINVTNGFALDLEVAGLGESVKGALQRIPAAEDTSSFTARPWITIDKNHMEAGTNQTLTVTISVPSGASPAEKYASIYLNTLQSTGGNATIISGIIVPLVLTVDSPSFTGSPSGQITDLSVTNAYRGKPVDVLTSFTNTGNCRVTDAKNKVTIKDSAQVIKWQNEAPITAPSVLPNYPRIIDTPYNIGLPLGDYSATSDITLTGGTVYTRTLNFTVVEPPPLPATPSLTAPGNSISPGPVIDTLTPTFQWNALSSDYKVDSYELSIVREPYTTNDVVFVSDAIAGTSFTLPSDILFPGEKYCWQLTATNVTGTSAASALYFQTTGAEPSVATNAATNITDTGAVLNGYLNGRGNSSSVSVNFEYGTTTSYGQTTSSQTLIAAGPFSANITGLTSDTTYHFRTKAVGSTTFYGSDQTFTTSGSLVVSSISATSVTSTGATLNGNLTSLGGATSVSVNFEYGTTTVYGQTTSAQMKAASGNFSADVSGLTPNTTYHFHAKALESTTVYGTDLTFTTLAATPTPTQTVAPTLVPSASATPTNSPVSRSYKDYFPPVIDEASLIWKDFTGQQAFSFDATEKTGTEMEITGTNNRGTLTAIAVQYPDEPQTEAKFSNPASKGGMGRPWIKFVGVRVEGSTQGTARVTLHYTGAEIADYNPDSLFLAYFSGGSWHKCGNTAISADNLTVSGDIPISRLSGTAIGLGGTWLTEPAAAAGLPISENGQSNAPGIPWSLAAIVIVPIIMIGLLVLVLERNRRRSLAGN